MRRTTIYFILVILFALINFYFRPVSGNPLVTKDYQNSPSYVNDLYYSEEYFKKKLISEKYYYLYEQVLEDVKDGKNVNTITCKEEGCSNAFAAVLEAISLDHPEFFSYQTAWWRDYKSSVEVHYSCMSSWKYYLGTKRIERELDIVKRETKNMSDKEKILYVYDYVASHNYDRLFTYSSSNQSAYSFFTKGSSVCAGFAKASQLIFQNIGIKSYLVHGYEHMWNYVEYEGKYYVFDATVGSSYYNKKHQNYYEGLARTTVGERIGEHKEVYPTIEEKTLKELFGM